MASESQLDLVLMWHMHQPDFRDHATGEFAKPWVYLHALKDYTDMAAHLEAHAGVRAVVNFTPVLLDQLEDYVDQFASGNLRDPLLRLLTEPDLMSISDDARTLILDQCFRANHTKMVEPYPAYRRLRDLYNFTRDQGDIGSCYLSGQYIGDLITWYHLAWVGETVRRRDPTVAQLQAQSEGFSHDHRRQLFALYAREIANVIPRYRALAARGQIELSSTPEYHPIGPLLISLQSARESQPDAPLPAADNYPGGRTRTRAHIVAARESHARRFGAPPRGYWPAEGAVSRAFIELLASEGCEWVASGEGVLTQSLARTDTPVAAREQYLYRPYGVKAGDRAVTCFFRDERLSDLIGFEYAKWHGSDAAAHFMAQLDAIVDTPFSGRRPLVSVILDGENAWEYYPYNGYYFLNELYSALENHDAVRTTTFAAVLDQAPATEPLATLVAGSWVYGNFATWIGSTDKNRAWDLLCAAKQAYDLVAARGELSVDVLAEATRQLSDCEGSDWFWWFGDYNPGEAVAAFDQLFRQKLGNLYRLLRLPVPPQLSVAISLGGGKAELSGAMRRAS